MQPLSRRVLRLESYYIAPTPRLSRSLAVTMQGKNGLFNPDTRLYHCVKDEYLDFYDGNSKFFGVRKCYQTWLFKMVPTFKGKFVIRCPEWHLWTDLFSCSVFFSAKWEWERNGRVFEARGRAPFANFVQKCTRRAASTAVQCNLRPSTNLQRPFCTTTPARLDYKAAPD